MPYDVTSEKDIPSFHPRVHSSPKGTKKRDLNNTVNNSRSNSTIPDELNYSTLSNETDDSDLPLNDLPNKQRQWRSTVVNANSIKGKLADLEYLIHTTNADQIIMTETKLGEDLKEVDIIY